MDSEKHILESLLKDKPKLNSLIETLLKHKVYYTTLKGLADGDKLGGVKLLQLSEIEAGDAIDLLNLIKQTNPAEVIKKTGIITKIKPTKGKILKFFLDF